VQNIGPNAGKSKTTAKQGQNNAGCDALPAWLGVVSRKNPWLELAFFECGQSVSALGGNALAHIARAIPPA
jgi:hypothetical protein